MGVEASGMKIKVSACGLFLLDKELLFSVGFFPLLLRGKCKKYV
jgi:hypothetical protein